ncbi:Holliday junction resolvase RuvX [Candidatus Saccharibacteria bacterium]|nr:Holliday junction resolvase RuvX [Candidatus Saccharibacteria bacterium]
MAKNKQLLSLDVGAARIGVAIGDDGVRIAIPHGYIVVDGHEVEAVAEHVIANEIETIVIGYPRNQSGEPTRQTEFVESFARKLVDIDATVVFQDESLTSVMAERRLMDRGVAYEKGDIDSEAAAIILQDYMEQRL